VGEEEEGERRVDARARGLTRDCQKKKEGEGKGGEEAGRRKTEERERKKRGHGGKSGERKRGWRKK